MIRDDKKLGEIELNTYKGRHLLNKDEFDKCMAKQKEMARSASKKVSGMNVQGDIVNFEAEVIFTGYDELETNAKAIFVGDENGNRGDIYYEGTVIFDKTPFYATKGGQLGDIGAITGDNVKAEVLKTESTASGAIIHYVRIISGDINEGDVVTLSVDKENRFKTSQNHSATHLLQKSLQEVLGDEVHQKGSSVDFETLRFDFNYSGKINDDDIIKVEELVNEKIKACLPNETKVMSLEEAKKTSAMALFDEKYGDSVRVVKFGNSIELCGGTHVKNTGDIRSFAIKSIESKGLNIYRIEAVCDTNLSIELFEVIKPWNDEMILLLKKARNIVNEANKKGITLTFNPVISNERPVSYKDILENKNEVLTLRKQIADLEKEYKEEIINNELKNVDNYVNKKVNGKHGEVVILSLENYEIDVIKTLAGAICSKLQDGIAFIVNSKENAINFVAKASDALKDKINLGSLIKDVAKIAEGNGGGSPIFAQGGGTRQDKLEMILEYVKQNII